MAYYSVAQLLLLAQLFCGEGGTMQMLLACVRSAPSGWTTWGHNVIIPDGHAPPRTMLQETHLCHWAVPGGPCISSEELASGYHTPGRYELPRIPGRHG